MAFSVFFSHLFVKEMFFFGGGPPSPSSLTHSAAPISALPDFFPPGCPKRPINPFFMPLMAARQGFFTFLAGPWWLYGRLQVTPPKTIACHLVVFFVLAGNGPVFFPLARATTPPQDQFARFFGTFVFLNLPGVSFLWLAPTTFDPAVRFFLFSGGILLVPSPSVTFGFFQETLPPPSPGATF